MEFTPFKLLLCLGSKLLNLFCIEDYLEFVGYT